jgi:two-component system response regulator RegA
MIAVVERDRRLAQRLATALEARGCQVRIAHGYRRARTILRSERPAVLYVSESLQRASGGDLLADFERDEVLRHLPVLVRVSHSDSVFARAMRRGGLQTVEAPLDVEAVAERLARMERSRARKS